MVEAPWRKDSDTVFTAISTSGARDYNEAVQMVAAFYIPSPEISRAGISHALERLRKHYAAQSISPERLKGRSET